MPEIELNGGLTKVFMGNITLWFSYTTLVAFRVKAEKVVCQNYWSKTTGKHLNDIDDGLQALRVDKETFERRWNELSKRI